MVNAGCVFVAVIRPSRTRTSGSFKSVWWNARVHRLELTHLKEVFLGNGVRTHVNSKEKSPEYRLNIMTVFTIFFGLFFNNEVFSVWVMLAFWCTLSLHNCINISDAGIRQIFFRVPSHGVCLTGCDSAGSCILFLIYVSNIWICVMSCVCLAGQLDIHLA